MPDTAEHRAAAAAIAAGSESTGELTAIEPIREALRGLRYGIVSIIVQDGVVVQIERTEKRRLR